MVGDLLALIDKRWTTVQDIQRLLVAMPLGPQAQRIQCLRDLQRIFRLLPVQVFTDEAHREHLLTIWQLAMDQAIDDEEALLCGAREA
ncbi:TyeA family type III secretion system gatekeeper subunit [Pseudomonas soli]|uniref:TyeA family type III secretion system gatekeeper subunit n=1 Tax=Pseudomonas soli TaxID=1306993 RepID=UPI0028A68473|nr:TyeA family type III secretion system gatekeeper subunit [Pseudomonas soli]